MKRVIFLLLVLAFICQGCDMAKYRVFKSYITRYYNAGNIGIDTTFWGNIRIYGVRGEESSGEHYSWYSEGKEKEKYEELCQIHNDVSYNKKREYHHTPEWGACSAIDFISIDVVSDSDFDDTHSKGVSLKDIVRFVSISPKKFIDSKYSDTFDWETDKPEIFKQDSIINRIYHIYEKQNYFPINKLLSEVGVDEMQLLPLTDYGFLVFDKEPTLEKEHTLTITIKTRNGKTYVKTIKKTFK
ncbi:MAG: hypothetical protein Q4A56_06815 [Porphyromonadaceae bacterium]|nr:hypothetical protein [Porphyromonadaceae bacterium]